MAQIISPQKAVKVTFALAPAYNIIGSLSLLDMAEGFSGLGEWIYQTAKALSPEQMRTNRLVLEDAYVHLANAAWPSFPAWLDDLATRDVTEMRDRALQAWLTYVSKKTEGEIPSASELLADRAAYLALAERFCRTPGHYESLLEEAPFDNSYWEERHRLLKDPPAGKDLIVTHLRTMWDGSLAAEWERNLPVLEESVTAFRSLNLSGLTVPEILSRVVMRAQIPDIDWFKDIEHLILIPSVHNGPYIVHLNGLSDTTVRFIISARTPEGVPSHLSALSRSELLVRLNALADDTRLRILELLARQGEMSTPDIRAQLELSQSAVSRHLEHLTATGYLIGEREQGTNLYRLNPDRIDHTFQALKKFCQLI
jgi:ArsR family transcriptional regulator